MRVLGRDGMLIVSMLCFVVRVFGYTLLMPSTRLYIIPLEALHGVTFACFWVTMTDVTKTLINEAGGWTTTIPTAIQMLYNAIGICLGSVLGGWAMKEYGSRQMYRVVAMIITFNLVFHSAGAILSRVFYGKGFLPEDVKEVSIDDDSCSVAQDYRHAPDNESDSLTSERSP